MTEAERALRAVLSSAEGVGDRHVAELGFGPIPLTVQADDAALLEQASAHASTLDTVHAWSPLRVLLATGRTLSRADLPAPLRPSTLPAQGTTIVRAGDLTAIVGDGMTWIVDDATGVALRWTETAADVPIWESIRPLRVALRWWSTRHGGALLHSAAVAREGRAMLLVGDAGAGKSTTAFSCLGRGLDVLGDDYCLVQPDVGGVPRVFTTYRLGNLTRRSMDLLPGLADRVRGVSMQGKLVVPLDALPPGRESATVVGVAAVTQQPGAAASLAPIRPMEVLQRLAPNTVSQIPGWTRQTLEVCSRVVASTPTYELTVGDVGTAAPVIADHLGRLP